MGSFSRTLIFRQMLRFPPSITLSAQYPCMTTDVGEYLSAHIAGLEKESPPLAVSAVSQVHGIACVATIICDP